MFKIYGPYVNSENSLVLCFFIFKYHTKNKNLKIPIRLFLLPLQQTTFFHLFMCWKIFFYFRQVCLWFPHSPSAAAFFNGIAFTFLNFIEFTSLVYVCLFFFFSKVVLLHFLVTENGSKDSFSALKIEAFMLDGWSFIVMMMMLVMWFVYFSNLKFREWL